MRAMNIYYEDAEFKQLEKIKKKLECKSWKDLIKKMARQYDILPK